MAEPERTPDGRHIIVDGRRWRASDPAIPEQLRARLVHELMAARRAVGAARGDDEAVAAARRRVQDAKVALGERGAAWWEPADAGARAERIAATIRSLLRDRTAEATICPSEAARAACSPDWRERMDEVRAVAATLYAAGQITILQRGEPVPDPAAVAGPIRLGRGGLLNARPRPPGA